METYKVKDVVNLPYEEIDNIQKDIDKKNLKVIEKAYQDGRINTDDYEYLSKSYADGMSVYREIYRTLYEIFKHPEYTCALDLTTGQVDTDKSGKKINYGLKAVTPFTCTRLDYVDKFHNPIRVIFPKMKNAERAIEKIESEYNKQRMEEMKRITDRFFIDEDRERYVESLQNVTKNSTRLHDITRLTITCKYFSDVERLKRVLSENESMQGRNFSICEAETRDRFLLPLKENEKKYYDIKSIMHQRLPNGDVIDVEVQLKIETLYNADVRNHKIYEAERQIAAELALNSSKLKQIEKRQKEAQIQIYKKRIRNMNENAIHQYNMMVLDKARRMEDDGYRPLRIEPDNPDGTYQQCRAFITREYLVETYDTFDPQTAFKEDDERNKLAFLRLIGKINNEFDETETGSEVVINHLFSRLKPAEKECFDRINDVALRYAPIINQKIKARYYMDEVRPKNFGKNQGKN